jgi:glutathione peroxidase
MSTIFPNAFNLIDIRGVQHSYKTLTNGKVVLVVNVASKCGFTPQYKGLQALYEKFGPDKFTILAFPCNQFASQEPGTHEEIEKFACEVYKTTFPLMAKVDVNGETANPFWKWLKQKKPGLLGTEAIKWNFTKFLVDPSGRVVERYGPNTTPEKIAEDIERLLVKAYVPVSQ